MKILLLDPCLSTAKRVGEDIFLYGTAQITETKHPNRFSERNTVESTAGLGNYFFYNLSHHLDSRWPLMHRSEVGIGKLESNGRLHREVVMGLSDYNDESDQWFSEGQLLTVSQYHPKTDICKEYFSNAIFTSDSIITLEPNQFIYCDAKGDLREGTARDISNLLNSQKKPLEVNKGVYFKPTLPPERPKAGTIVFNKRSGCLEFYDGLEWKEIA